jgi:predicted RNA-binding Zn ribbon-like protein
MADDGDTGAVELVRTFANTWDLDEGTDAIATPAALRSWLVERDLLPANARVTAADVERADSLRVSLREALRVNNGGVAATLVVDRCNAALCNVPLNLTFGDDGRPHFSPGGRGVDRALAAVVAAAAEAVADGTWDRLKMCAEHTCEWVFYDRSKNRSKTWCSMQVCGNRTKTRTYRARHTASA